MKQPWPDLEFWQCGEWDVIQERLDDLDKLGVHEVQMYNPKRKDLFKALRLTKFEDVKVMVCGQDPYPDPEFATGLAFSIPPIIRPNATIPVTLANIFTEYSSDLHYPYPKNGDLTKWCEQGVLLWNVVPSCATRRSLSHNWNEWTYLTLEIIEKLNSRGIVFVFLGGVAREYVKYVKDPSMYLEFSHPSPRASKSSRNPFLGSRMFTKTNALVTEQGFEPIDWCLNHVIGYMGVRADNTRDFMLTNGRQ